MELFSILIRISRARLVSGDAEVEGFSCIMSPLSQRLRVQHLTVVTTAIYFIDAGAIVEVDLSVL